MSSKLPTSIMADPLLCVTRKFENLSWNALPEIRTNEIIIKRCYFCVCVGLQPKYRKHFNRKVIFIKCLK